MRYFLGLFTLIIGAVVWASEGYKPPEDDATWQKTALYLKPIEKSSPASGAALFACNLAETQHRCQLYAKHLTAQARYTLWLVNMEGNKVKQTHEVTSRWRPLRADPRGVLSFIGNLPWCPVGRDVLVVKSHANERGLKFSDGVTVLKGTLRKRK